MSHRIITPAVRLPVSLPDLKQHLRLDHDEDDGLLAGYLSAAVNHVEMITNRHLLDTVVETTLPCFPNHPIELRGRVSAITWIKYRDAAGTQQTVDPASYRLNAAAEPGRVYLTVNAFCPPTQCAEDAVTVRYTSGYGPAASDVPEAVRHALLLLASLWYEQRVPVSIGASVSAIPFGIECLLTPHKVWSF